MTTFFATIYQFILFLRRNTNPPHKQFLYIEQLYKIILACNNLKEYVYMSLTSPYYHKLIPDADIASQKTLVINLDKTLISYTYKMGKGFEIMKRPGLNKFLLELANFYEIVIFGTEDSNFVTDICSKIDPHNMLIKYKLGREATRFELGGYVKDMRFLNRNLKNVICIDFHPNNTKYTPGNTVIIPEFNGDVNDKELLQLIQFLKDMAKPNVKDVREEIQKYGSYKPHIKYYKSIPKYRKLLPKEEKLADA
eukprot:CAMPEP_0170515350 /NCGR_PEP_ID=MMETSP0209-20121228/1791_1 /TAXON_ID=665100 ORGANISM="Litonotus pictus, Strain P1" /NCGR_SAMPLE_ID=MMETSP0209 /ASSEMBLY_ACC=CAM_ASM_000301 /LENGTH=251 /DNA_ID=CAMNT_0010799793 /DNA_START=436 /DNA_END=1194 /DNA_ORIENTATION=-